MKIHAMYGLDLPTTNATGNGSNVLITRLPNGPWQSMSTNSETNFSIQVWTDGWLRMGIGAGAPNFGNYRFRAVADIKEMIPVVTPTSNLYFGVRVKAGTGYTGSTVVTLSSAVDINNLVNLFQITDLPGYVIDKSYYVEFNLNFANNTIDRRVDGKPLAQMAMPAWMATAVSASPGGTSVYVGIGASFSYSISQGQTHYFWWRDFYCVEWEAGELAQFLGPQVVEKVPVDTVAATAWTASTGTATSVLKTGYSNPSTAIGAPTLTTDDAMTPGSITYNPTNIPVNAVLNGILVKGRSAVSVNATGNLGVSATVGGVESSDANVAMVAAQTFYDRMLFLTKTPGGLPWTQPALAGLTVKAKPKV
jgi:hypothetical protein